MGAIQKELPKEPLKALEVIEAHNTLLWTILDEQLLAFADDDVREFAIELYNIGVSFVEVNKNGSNI